MYSKRTLYVTLARMTLKAWEATHPQNMVSIGNAIEPDFIITLYASQTAKPSKQQGLQNGNLTTPFPSGWDSSVKTSTGVTPSPMDDDALFASLAGDMTFNMSNDFMNNNYTANWMFWDQYLDAGSTQGL